MTVSVVTMGKEKKEVPYKDGMTVAQVLAEVDAKAAEKATITVDGKPAKLDTKVKDNAKVVVVPKIKNG